jgi:tetratricopeptide (TPR) repeat protein/predicted membrane-bound spermidine synthase
MTEEHGGQTAGAALRPRVADWLVPNATVFLSSACIMIVELVAGRVISRHLGQSLYTWTSVIGVVLAGVSIGNYVGGRLADRFPARRTLSLLFALAALSCFSTLALNNLAGGWSTLWERTWPVRILLHVSITFLLPSAVLGTISPVVAKMAIETSRNIGRTIGGVYAWGAIGSIFGTFLAGFYLIAQMGTTAVVAVVGILLAALGMVYGARSWLPFAWTSVCVLAGYLAVGPGDAAASIGKSLLLRERPDPNLVYEDESNYSHIAVLQNPARTEERAIYLDKLEHSIIDLGDPLNLRYAYTWVYEGVIDAAVLPPKPVRALVLGGGGYAFPQFLELSRPGSDITVVEIDPAVTKAAFAGCGLRPETSIKTFHMDARNFVAERHRALGTDNAAGGYDFILGDSVSDFSVPYQLTTVEFTRMVSDLLGEDGIYLLNMIDMFEVGRFLGAVVNTCKAVFPHVYVFSCKQALEGRDTFVLVCSKRERDTGAMLGAIRQRRAFQGGPLGQEQIDALAAKSKGMVLTDDYSPVENLLAEVVRLDPGDVLEKHITAGVAAAKRGDLDEAIREFTRTVRIHPGYARGYYNLGVAFSDAGRPDEALDAFAMAVQIEPDYVDARNSAALVLARSGHLDAAIAQWQEVLAKRPDSADAHNNLGNALAAVNRLPEATGHWIEAIRLNPQSASAYNNLANYYASVGDATNARAHYEEALRLRPEMAEAHNNLGTLLAEGGDVTGAVEHFRSALRIQPGLPAAQANLEKWEGGAQRGTPGGGSSVKGQGSASP